MWNSMSWLLGGRAASCGAGRAKLPRPAPERQARRRGRPAGDSRNGAWNAGGRWRTLERNAGNQTVTARQLGIGAATLYRKLKQYGALAKDRARAG
jgi:transcriptional regulator of acetoin/glycerol metabolism